MTQNFYDLCLKVEKIGNGYMRTLFLRYLDKIKYENFISLLLWDNEEGITDRSAIKNKIRLLRFKMPELLSMPEIYRFLCELESMIDILGIGPTRQELYCKYLTLLNARGIL